MTLGYGIGIKFRLAIRDYCSTNLYEQLANKTEIKPKELK